MKTFADINGMSHREVCEALSLAALNYPAIAQEQKSDGQSIETDMQQLGEAFSALAGRTGLKKYPAKFDDHK